MEDGGDFDLWMFVHDEQLDAALKTPNFDLDSQSLFEDAWGVGGTIGDSGDAMPTFRLVNSAVEKSVDLPAQSKPANQTEWEVVRAVIESGPHDETAMDIETQYRSRLPHGRFHRTPDAIDTRVQSADLKHVGRIGSEPENLVEATTKIINADIIPRGDDLQSQERACERFGIAKVVGATSRLETALGTSAATQPMGIETCLSPSAHPFEVPSKAHLRKATPSEPHMARLPVRLRNRDVDTTYQKRLASPFREVHHQPRQPRVVIDLTEDDEPEAPIGPILATDPVATPTSLDPISDHPRPISNKRKHGRPAASVSRDGKRPKLHRDSKVSPQGHADLQTAFMKPVVDLTVAGMAEADAEIKDLDEARHKFLTAGMKCSPQKTMNFLEANTKARKVALGRKDMWSEVAQHLEAWDVKDKEVTAQLESSR